MSNSMSLEKIFIILALILGFASAVDLICSFIIGSAHLDEILRCSLNVFIAGCLYFYFNKRRKAKADL